VKNVVGAIHVKVTQLERERASGKPTESLEAYDLVLRARQLVSQLDRRSNREARTHLAKALELSPGYPDALIILGEAEIQRSLYGWVEDPAEPMKRARELANRALSASDTRTHARAHYLMSRVHSNLARPDEALVHAERAVAANPSDTVALFWHGVSLLYAGRLEDGVAVMEGARKLDPMMSEGNGVNLATGYYTAGRYRDALALGDQLIARYPRDVASHSIRAAALSQLGEDEQAREAAAQVRRLNPYYDLEFVGLRFANPEHRAKLREGMKKAGL
jgi:adenylate cyclase